MSLKAERFLPSTPPTSWINFKNSENEIVRSSLALYLDASNSSSYPGTGTTWFDISGNGRNASLINSPTFSNTNGGEINFSGTQYATLPANVFNFGTGSYSIEAWVLNNSAVTNNIWYSSQSSNSTGFYGAGYNISTGWFHTTFDGSTRPTSSKLPIASPNGWSHHVIVRSGNTITQYVNGFQASTNATTSMSMSAADVRIGQNPATNGERWNGKIAIIRIYNKELSKEEILNNFNLEKNKFDISSDTDSFLQSSPLFYFDPNNLACFPGSGTTVFDLGGFNRNATLYNSMTTSNTAQGFKFFSFNGSNQYMQLESQDFGSFEGGITIAAFVNFGNANSWERIIDFGSGQAASNIGFAREATSQTLMFFHYNGATPVFQTGASNYIANNAWAFYAVTVNKSSAKYWSNLNTTTISTTTIPVQTTRSINYIGRSNWNDAYFETGIGQIAMWNVALEDEQLINIFNTNRSRYGI